MAPDIWLTLGETVDFAERLCPSILKAEITAGVAEGRFRSRNAEDDSEYPYLIEIGDFARWLFREYGDEINSHLLEDVE